MKRDALYVWRNLTEDGSVRWLKYSFGPGTANTLAVRRGDDGWLVISPAVDAPSAVLDELAQDGPVRLLLAPNPFHYLGQQAWRARFPDAMSLAPAGALPRLAARAPMIPFRAIDEIAPRLAPRIRILEPDGMKVPDLFVFVRSGASRIWWSGDLIANVTADDQVWLFRHVSRLFGAGLGYRRNTKPGLVYVRELDAWLRSVDGAIAEDPPSIVVPAHGDPVTEDAALRTQRLVAEPANALSR